MTVAEVEAAVVALGNSLSDEPPADRAGLLRMLRDLHLVLARATPSGPTAPVDCLRAAASLADQVNDDIVNALAVRTRTVFRLLRLSAWAAAWELLAENAVGLVEHEFSASTATGAARTSWRLPLLTRIEGPTVFAELPGFRDPRFDVPDACYDITTSIVLSHQVDELLLDRDVLTLGGWAALDILTAEHTEVVTLIAARDDREIATVGRRVRRADLVKGRGEALTRRAWAGWSARLDLTDPQLRTGSWALSLQLDHRGVSRRTPLGPASGELALAAASASGQGAGRGFTVKTVDGRWRLAAPAGG
jgi:hypothetical protein